MIYFLFWLVVVLQFTGLIGQLHRQFRDSKHHKSSASTIGGITGVMLRSATVFWLLILVHPVLKFVS